MHLPEFLNTLKCSGLPKHELKLKISIPVMLIWNLNYLLRLCNGTWLVIVELGHHVIKAKVIFESNFGDIIYIPRMLLVPFGSQLPSKF